MSAVRQRRLARVFDGIGVMFTGEGLQTEQDSHRFGAADLRGGLGPFFGMRTDRRGLPQQSVGAPFDGGDLFFGNVLRRGTKAAWFRPRVNGNRLPLVIEQPHRACIPTRPQAPTDKLRRRRIVRLGDFDVTVAADGTSPFLKRGETVARQRQQCSAFGRVEPLANLLLGRTVDPRVGNVRFPIEQMVVLFDQAVERAPLSALFLAYLTPFSILPLCSGRYGLVGKNTVP